jgi:hypothetical protein
VSCSHTTTFDADGWQEPTPDATDGCADCQATGQHGWVHLRKCLQCGHVACCDSSPNQHASKHAAAATHPVLRSFEPGESWRWCMVDEALV